MSLAAKRTIQVDGKTLDVDWLETSPRQIASSQTPPPSLAPEIAAPSTKIGNAGSLLSFNCPRQLLPGSSFQLDAIGENKQATVYSCSANADGTFRIGAAVDGG